MRCKVKRIIRKTLASLLIGSMMLPMTSNLALYAQEPVDLLLRYEFDTISGAEVEDISGNGQTANIVGNSVHTSQGKTGLALQLDQDNGNNGYVELPDDIVKNLEDFTITTWIKVDKYAAWSRVFDFGKDSNTYMFFTASNSDNGGNMIYAISNGSSNGEQKISLNTKFEIGRWTHLAIVQKGETVTLYIDGIAVASSKAFTKNPKNTIGSSANNYLGKSQFAQDKYFAGGIDDFRIYNSAISHEDILNIKAEKEKTIQHIEAVNITTRLGEEPKLPNSVVVTYEDGKTGNEAVAWEMVTEEMLYSSKSYCVSGKIGRTDKVATADIQVESLSEKESLGIELSVNNLLTDPLEATASYKIANYSSNQEKLTLVYDFYDLEGNKLQENRIERNLGAGEHIMEDISFNIPKEYDPYKTEIRITVLDEEGNEISEACTHIPETIPYGSMFEDDAVVLEEGMFKTSQELNMELFLTYDIDRLCAPLFEATESGTGAKAKRYGGWESRDIAGVAIGHYMSAAALMYKQTGNPIFKEKLDYAVSEVARAQEQNGTGFVGGYGKAGYKSAEERFVKNVFEKPDTFDVNQYNLGGIWDCWYSIQKIFKGALEAYMLTGNEQGLEIAEKFAAWTKYQTDKLNYEQMQRMLFSEYGGMAETLVWLYQETGKEEYLTLAERFIRRTTQMDYLSEGRDDLDGRHANEQMPEVTGAAAYYTVTGDEYMKKGVEFFWNAVTQNRSYANGGNSNSEHFPTLGTEPLSTTNTETCNTFNLLKLTEYIYSWDHNSQYMDFYENALYNHILTTQDPLTGQKVYFTPLSPGGFRTYSTTEDSWWCCNLSGMENPARYNKMIYYKDNRDLYVNLFISSSAKWKETGMEFTQETDFPNSDTTTLHITKGADNVNIKFRVPGWTVAEEVRVWINEEEQECLPIDGYITLHSNWNDGDKIKVQYPMQVNLYRKKDNENSIAVKYGPILLAAPLGKENYPSTDYANDQVKYKDWPALKVPRLVTNETDPNEWVIRTNDKELEFTTTAIARPGNSEITLVPFYSIHHERYNVYWDFYTEEEYNAIKDVIEEKLDLVTSDIIRFGNEQSESEHNFKINASYTGTGYNNIVGCTWRDMRGAGNVTVTMKVEPDSENYLYACYLGSDGPVRIDGINYVREFDIYVEGEKIATQTLNVPLKDKPYIVFYDIPKELTEGKETITLSIGTTENDHVTGGLFEFRTVTENLNKSDDVAIVSVNAIKNANSIEIEAELKNTQLATVFVVGYNKDGEKVCYQQLVDGRASIPSKDVSEIKVFCWNSLSGLVPYCDPITVKVVDMR